MSAHTECRPEDQYARTSVTALAHEGGSTDSIERARGHSGLLECGEDSSPRGKHGDANEGCKVRYKGGWEVHSELVGGHFELATQRLALYTCPFAIMRSPHGILLSSHSPVHSYNPRLSVRHQRAVTCVLGGTHGMHDVSRAIAPSLPNCPLIPHRTVPAPIRG